MSVRKSVGMGGKLKRKARQSRRASIIYGDPRMPRSRAQRVPLLTHRSPLGGTGEFGSRKRREDHGAPWANVEIKKEIDIFGRIECVCLCGVVRVVYRTINPCRRGAVNGI